MAKLDEATNGMKADARELRNLRDGSGDTLDKYKREQDKKEAELRELRDLREKLEAIPDGGGIAKRYRDRIDKLHNKNLVVRVLKLVSYVFE